MRKPLLLAVAALLGSAATSAVAAPTYSATPVSITDSANASASFTISGVSSDGRYFGYEYSGPGYTGTSSLYTTNANGQGINHLGSTSSGYSILNVNSLGQVQMAQYGETQVLSATGATLFIGAGTYTLSDDGYVLGGSPSASGEVHGLSVDLAPGAGRNLFYNNSFNYPSTVFGGQYGALNTFNSNNTNTTTVVSAATGSQYNIDCAGLSSAVCVGANGITLRAITDGVGGADVLATTYNRTTGASELLYAGNGATTFTEVGTLGSVNDQRFAFLPGGQSARYVQYNPSLSYPFVPALWSVSGGLQSLSAQLATLPAGLSYLDVTGALANGTLLMTGYNASTGLNQSYLVSEVAGTPAGGSGTGGHSVPAPALAGLLGLGLAGLLTCRRRAS